MIDAGSASSSSILCGRTRRTLGPVMRADSQAVSVTNAEHSLPLDRNIALAMVDISLDTGHAVLPFIASPQEKTKYLR